MLGNGAKKSRKGRRISLFKRWGQMMNPLCEVGGARGTAIRDEVVFIMYHLIRALRSGKYGAINVRSMPC